MRKERQKIKLQRERIKLDRKKIKSQGEDLENLEIGINKLNDKIDLFERIKAYKKEIELMIFSNDKNSELNNIK